jgi:hypothetical protein
MNFPVDKKRKQDSYICTVVYNEIESKFTSCAEDLQVEHYYKFSSSLSP